ncbi:MAG TPA: hypothetical protein VHN77_14775 [Phycisphaerales bacterium]|nr:hypothetical protein [Phycisphaerales bacterium]
MSDYDALTDLFLSDGGPAVKPRPVATLKLTGNGEHCQSPSLGAEATQTAARSRANRELVIEGLILGHLPVLGAAWVAQYAKHLAESTHEPIALVRLQGGQISIDVVTGRGTGDRVSGIDSERETLDDALAAARMLASRWLVRVDDTSEPDLLALEGLAAVTLLTGADDAAIVSSYRTMKGLCSLTKEGESHAPAFNLAIMGAADDKAAAAEAKIRRAAMTFLGRDVDATARVAKIGAGSATPVFRGEWTGGLSDALSAIRSASPVEPTAQPTHAAPLAAPRPVMQAVPSSSLVEPKATIAPSPMSGVQTAAPHSETAPGLPDGLTPLDCTCPSVPSVRLAQAADGSLHLIALSGSDGVRDLLAAASWAAEHAKLLSLAFPGVAMSAVQSGPTLHLLTTDARTARPLLDTAVRVHLAVEFGGTTVLRPLN